MATFNHLFSLLVIVGLLVSCSSSQQSTKSSTQQTEQQVSSEYYTSSFPQEDVTNLLKQAQQSVVRIVATGYYNSFNFNESYVTLDDIRTNKLNDIASSKYSFEESTAGTSIILDQSDNNTLLITCEHVVAFPDTAITYYKGDNIPSRTYVKSISVKTRQTNLAYTGPTLESFEIIGADSRLDLALLNVQHESTNNLDLHPLAVKSGASNFLKLGSFLYILGFPKGYAMITRGLASSSESWNDRFFVTDALFNPGISGGLILATNSNFNSFEWVGMASSATANREDVLVPRPASDKYNKAARPYRDSVFVQEKTRINYGITQAIPINKIKEFLMENKEAISREGFSLSQNRLSQN